MFAPDPEFLPEELKRLLLSAPVRQWLKYEGVDPDAAAIPVRNENAGEPIKQSRSKPYTYDDYRRETLADLGHDQ